MNMMDMLQKTGGLDSIARELNIDQGAAKMGAEALMPAILGGFKKNAQAQGGMGSLMGVIGQLGGGGLLSNVLGPATTDVSQGNNVLGEILALKKSAAPLRAMPLSKPALILACSKKCCPCWRCWSRAICPIRPHPKQAKMALVLALAAFWADYWAAARDHLWVAWPI